MKLLSTLLIGFSLLTPAFAEFDDKQQPPICRFAVPPFHKGLSFNDERKKYLPLMGFMSEQTGCRFVAVGARSYEDSIEKITSGKVVVAELGAVTYVEAKRKNPGLEILATAMTRSPDGSKLVDYYRSVWLVRSDNPSIESVQDLRGRSVGFVSEHSSSGYIYSTHLLKDQGIDYRTHFGKRYFLGSHPNVTNALLAGSIEAGTTSDKNYYQAVKQHGDRFRVIWESPPISNVVYVAHPSLATEMRQKLRDSLPRIDARLLSEISLVKGFAHRGDSFYDITRRILDDE
jgi:phosphonate transport system substrate-binding protein